MTQNITTRNNTPLETKPKPLIIYCYDAYCGWCYGFAPVIRQLVEQYEDRVDFEVLSGGMILPARPRHVATITNEIFETCQQVEKLADVHFGDAFLWHLKNPGLSDWFPSSEKSAAALCIFKEYHPGNQVAFATDLSFALYSEGRDLCDDEAYRHLLDSYHIPATEFYQKLNSPKYRAEAQHDFDMVKALGVTGYPFLLGQADQNKIVQLVAGYTGYEEAERVMNGFLENYYST